MPVTQARADTSADVAATLDAFHRAAAEANFVDYQALMSDEIVFLGTDGTERWQGKAFREFARPHFVPGGGWTYLPADRHIAVADNGKVAWFDEELENTGLGHCRGSGVVILESGGWKIAQYNLSIPIPNAMADGISTGIAAYEKNLGASIELAADGEVSVRVIPVETDAELGSDNQP